MPVSRAAYEALANRVITAATESNVTGVGGSIELDPLVPGPSKLIGAAIARYLACEGPAWGAEEGSKMLCLVLIVCTPPDLWGMGPVNRSATENSPDAITWIE
jgi:hypothetical protein